MKQTGQFTYATQSNMPPRPNLNKHSQTRGFSLIELMIVVAIVAILAKVALPAYSDYVLRARLVDGTNLLSSLRAQMEQYYQDSRSYSTPTGGTIKSPCDSTNTTVTLTAGQFTAACSGVSASAYMITATGSSTTASFIYIINQSNTQWTTRTSWGHTSTTCWLMRSSDAC